MDINWKKALLKIAIGIGFIILLIFLYKAMLVASVSKSPLYQNAPICDKLPPVIKENETNVICKVNNLSWVVCSLSSTDLWPISGPEMVCRNISINNVEV